MQLAASSPIVHESDPKRLSLQEVVETCANLLECMHKERAGGGDYQQQLERVLSSVTQACSSCSKLRCNTVLCAMYQLPANVHLAQCCTGHALHEAGWWAGSDPIA